MEEDFNTNTYSIILAKMMLVQKGQWNIEINDFENDAEKAIRMVYVNSFRPVLENISKEYEEFKEVLTNYDNSILNADPYPKSYTDAFDKIAFIQKDKPELKENEKYNILMAATLANVYNYEYLNSIDIFLKQLKGKEILGFYENSLLATALYYCNYNNDMKELTKDNYYKLLAEGFGQKDSKQDAKKEESQTKIKEIKGFNFFKKYFSKYEFLFNEKKLITIGFIGVILLAFYTLTFSMYAGRSHVLNAIKSAIVNLINNPTIIGYAFLFLVLLLPLKTKKEKMQSIAQIIIVLTQLLTIIFALDYARGITRIVTPVIGLIILVYFITIFFTDKRFINNNVYLVSAFLSIISGIITMFIRGHYMETSVVLPTSLWLVGNIMVVPYFYNLYYTVEVGKKINLKNIINK